MRFVKGFFRFIKWTLVGLALVLIISSWWQRRNGKIQPMFFGWGSAIVQTDSMEPNVPVGALIIIHEQDCYEVGDVVTYIDYRGCSITHRVEFIQNGIVSTRGDNNEISDSLFSEDKIVGKMAFMIPGAGKFLDYLRRPGMIGNFILVVFLCIALDIGVRKILRAKKSKRNKPAFNTTVKSYKPK